MKIVGVDNYTNMNMEELEEDLNKRNFTGYQEKCKILNIDKNDTTNKTTTAPREIYKHISDNQKKIFIGYQSCKVWDIVNIKPCFKCTRYRHNTSK